MSKLSYDNYFSDEKKPKRPSKGEQRALRLLSVLVILTVISYFAFKFYSDYQESLKIEKPVYGIYTDSSMNLYDSSKSQWEKVDIPFEMYEGDRIVTGGSSRTILKYDGENNFRLAPLTELSYRTFTRDALILALFQGRVWAENSTGKLRIDTYRCSVFLTSGKVQVKIDEKQRVFVYCYSGPVEITTPAIINNQIALKSGEMVAVDDNNEISSPSAFSISQMDKWEKWNFSFSANHFKVGQEPPPYRYVVPKKDIQLVFEKSKQEVKAINIQEERKKKTKTAQKTKSYPKAKPHYRDWRKVPALRPAESFPEAAGGPENQSEKPGIPRIDVVDDYPTSPGGRRNHQQGSFDSGGTDDGYRKNRTEKSEESEREKLRKKAKGGMYYLENDQRAKQNPAKVPGYDLNSEPAGPAENPYNE